MVCRIENLSVGYHAEQPILTIKDFSLSSGDLVFVLGPSGIGKSTLMETLGLMNETILNPGQAKYAIATSGETTNIANIWSDSERERTAVRQHISFIFQMSDLMPQLTVRENIVMSATELPSKDFDAHICEGLERLGMSRDLLHSEVTRLSGGQRQRIVFLRALQRKFKLLLGDEPTGNLDQGNARQLMQYLKETIRTSGGAALVVTHDFALADLFADRIVYLDDLHPIVDAKSIYFRNEGVWMNDFSTLALRMQKTDFS